MHAFREMDARGIRDSGARNSGLEVALGREEVSAVRGCSCL